jgi:hypothetical protein
MGLKGKMRIAISKIFFLFTIIRTIFYSNMPWKNNGEYGCVENLQSFFVNVCMFEVFKMEVF